MATRIKLRFDTYENWNFSGGTLSQGELGLVDYGTHIDIHAGASETPTVWSSCPVVNEGVTTLSGLTDVSLTDLSNGDILLYSNNEWIASPGAITLNGTSIAPGDTATITANTQNSLSFGTGLVEQGAGAKTFFDGSSSVTLAVDITKIPLSFNNFWVGNSEGFPEEILSTGTGDVVRAISPTLTGTLNVENLVLSGNLTVNGTTTTINTNTLTVEDKNIELGFTTNASNVTADGGGITLRGTTDKTFNWINVTDSWTSSEHLNLVSEKEYKINGTGVLKSDALGSGLFSGSNSRTSPQNGDKLLIYHSGDWSSWITWENLKSSLEAAISGIDVDLNMPGIFAVAKDANTDGTTFNVTFETQNANLIFAGPSTGSAAAPTFRSLVTNDLPDVAGLTPSTYRSVTVDAKGRVTNGTNPTTLSGYGITDALSNSNTSTQNGYFGDIYLQDDNIPSHYLQITNSANLTAARILSINVEDSNRSITMGGNLTLSGATIIGSDANSVQFSTTGNTNITLPTTGTIAVNNQTMHIGTTSVTINRASSNLALTGITSVAMPGSTSGTITLQPTATAGTHTITLPATTGTVITTGDTGTVTNTMLSSSTISGIALGSNLHTLTIGTGLSGTSYNGSAAITIALNANLSDLLDVNISSLSEGNILVYDGTQGWINTSEIFGGNASSFV